VILMSGSPAAKSPVDWWAQCEIAWPGFIKEGSVKAFKNRVAFIELQDFPDGKFNKLVGWKDDIDKCNECGKYQKEHGNEHRFIPSQNEVLNFYNRARGLVTFVGKDCLDLPPKQYREIYCDPSPSIKRASAAITRNSLDVMTSLTLLRELSDGFQYRNIEDGLKKCKICEGGLAEEFFDPADPDRTYLGEEFNKKLNLQVRLVDCPQCDGTGMMTKTKRTTKQVKTPKEAILNGLLDECEETGRIVIFAVFRGTLDLIQKQCHDQGWDVVRCDGLGYRVFSGAGKKIHEKDPLGYWADMGAHRKVAFVAHPKSGGMGIDLVESSMAVFYSNDFMPESRAQSEDRIHRLGMQEDRTAIIVDIYHLPIDKHIRDVLLDNRKLELMSMDQLNQYEAETGYKLGAV